MMNSESDQVSDPFIAAMLEVYLDDNASHQERGQALDLLLRRARKIYPMPVADDD